MTKAIIMGLKVEPRIMDTSQSNLGTRGHHLPYPINKGQLIGFEDIPSD